jgi:hypothetical protein
MNPHSRTIISQFWNRDHSSRLVIMCSEHSYGMGTIQVTVLELADDGSRNVITFIQAGTMQNHDYML